MSSSRRGILIAIGVTGLLYSLALLEFVAITPDPRLRGFLFDEQNFSQTDSSPLSRQPELRGIVLQATPGLKFKDGQLPPRVGDRILSINRHPTPTILDYFRALNSLYFVSDWEITPVDVKDHPREWSSTQVPGLVREIDLQGNTLRRLVEVTYLPQEAPNKPQQAWIVVQSPPVGEMALSILWLIPHLVILLVAGGACWNRPFDRSAQIFYLMCVITMVAYVGGFHWWTAANSSWFVWPFIVCGVLLPAVILHFFLVYPKPSSWAIRFRGWLLAGIYMIPAITAVAAALFLLALRGTSGLRSGVSSSLPLKLGMLELLRDGVNVFLVAGAIYYFLILGVLVRTFVTVRDPLERAQVRWIFGAAILATVPVGYTLYLAATDRAAFAFGGAKYPMFFASFGFLFAYAAGMARYRLLLADEVFSKGLRYYAARASLTIGVAVALAAVAYWAGMGNEWLPGSQSAAFVTSFLILIASVLLILRDRIQQMLDRQFFSEKYQLGAVLSSVHAGVGPASSASDLGQRVIDSCHQALDVDRIAIYRREEGRANVYRLTAARGDFPKVLRVNAAVVESLEARGSVQRILAGARSEVSPRQELLRELSAQLLYAPPAREGTSTLLALGPKANDSTFTAEDLTFLSALGHVAEVAFTGAGMHHRLAEQLRLAEETIQSQTRQISVLHDELRGLHRHGEAEAGALDRGDFRREIIRGNSDAINDVLDTIRKVAGSDATVMIRGESGTGKELLAQVIHDNSLRPEGPLVRVHCAALSPTLLESELFGHVKGAFTGADKDKVGRFELANGGTLFLDEIGEISPETQVKLLRVMQERCFEPVGSSTTIHVDVRVVTATNRNLEEMISEGEFREDLYYRLNVISVTLPPLRERKGDVLDLAFTFLHRAARRMNRPISRIDEEALASLENYRWPGNVRELQNAIERAVVLADGDAIQLADLPPEVRNHRPTSVAGHLKGPTTSPPIRRVVARPTRERPEAAEHPPEEKQNVQDAERQELIDALARTKGNKARAARLLGIPRSTFFSKLKKYDLA